MYALCVYGGGVIVLLVILAIGYLAGKYPKTINEKVTQTNSAIHQALCNLSDGVDVKDCAEFFGAAKYELRYLDKK